MKTVKTYMVRKPSDLEEVESITQSHMDDAEIVEVTETIELTEEQYQEICDRPMNDYPFLAGKGGYEERNGEYRRQVIELTSKGKANLYVDPSGSSYCRYLGLEIK